MGGHHAGEDRRHPSLALQALHLSGFGHGWPKAFDELVDRPLGDGLLPEGGKHTGDVVEEQLAGPHEQNTPAAQVRVLVQEEGGSMQADRCLAGAGAALHHQKALQGHADELILF
jgi:hypothetical protein